MKNLNKKKIFILGLVLACVALFFAFDIKQYLSFEYIKQQQSQFESFYQQNPLLTIGAFFVIYVLSTGLSLPGATILTLLGGALFGLLYGTVIISFASTAGATMAFLVSRFLLRDTLQEKYGEKLKSINDGFEKDGNFYLLSLRLIPVVPFFLINLLMGLTPIKTRNFFFISQIGMLPGTIVYVNAGTQLAQLDSLKGILSPKLWVAFILLGILPLASKKILALLQNKRKQNASA